jgi:hypothetical protein
MNNELRTKNYCKLATGDRQLYSTLVERALQIGPFLTNKANFQKVKMNVNKVLRKDYENETLVRRGKTKPIQTQFKPNTNPIQSQYKPNTKPIQTQTKPILRLRSGQVLQLSLYL